MTKQSTFKRKIRTRMEKTGERYSAARLALLRTGGPQRTAIDADAVPGYAFSPLVEHDTGLLANALAQAGVLDPGTGAPFTQERTFGLSGGIGFMYFLFEYAGQAPMLTLTCRSWSMPGPLVERVMDAAGIAADRSETSSASVARRLLDAALAEGRAVHATIDAASLPSWGAPSEWIGRMPRQANVAGRTESGYLVDLGGPAALDGETLARARAAAKKEKHRAFSFAPGPAAADSGVATLEAVLGTADRYVTAPFAGYAANFGLAGLDKVARLATDTKDAKGWPRVFDTGPLAFLALTRTWECLTLDLTPPAGGRPLYADFLAAAASDDALVATAAGALRGAAELAHASGERFARLADDLVDLGGDAVARGVAILEEVDDLRRRGDAAAGAEVAALERERSALAEAYVAGPDARLAAYACVGEAFTEIAAIERELQRALASA